MADIIVIGAGVMGASVALRLAQAGASVLVLEAGRVGGGTSGTSFAWINAHDKPPRAYHDLNVAGMRAHAALRDEFGATPWWHGGGSLEWTTPENLPRHQANVAQLQAWGYAAEWITRSQLQELEPDIDADIAGDAPIAYFPEEGWLDPVPYAHAVLTLAVRRHNARLRCGVRVQAVVTAADRVTGVRTEDGSVHAADLVVNCAGRWANDPLAEAGMHLPLAPSVGFLVFTPPVASGLQRVVRTSIIDARPDGGGRLILHWNPTDKTLSLDTKLHPAMPEAVDMVARARRLLPGIGDVAPEAVRMALRPNPADGFSAIGPLPRIAGYYLAITHSAVTLSPFLGHAVAQEIMSGRDVPELAGFRPTRFFN